MNFSGLFLAQTSSSGPTFAQQIFPLILMTFVAGAAWVSLTVMISLRARERQRRKAEGLSPLPSFYRQATDWLKGQWNKQAPATSDTTQAADLPLPDVDSLTNEFGDQPPAWAAGAGGAEIASPLPVPDFEDLIEPNWQDLASQAPAVMARAIDSTGTFQTPAPEMGELVENGIIEDGIVEDVITETRPSLSSPVAAMPDDAIEIMRVMRDVVSGRLLVDLRGQIFSHPSQLADPSLQARFEDVLAELGRMAGPTSKQARPVAKVAAVVVSPSEGTPAPPAGIAAQIEAFLQYRLAAHPEYAPYGLHIHPDSSGGVRIEVAGRFYESVNDILEAQVREFLQKTIQDWSDQHY